MNPSSLYDAYLDAYSPASASWRSTRPLRRSCALPFRANPARPIPFSQVPIHVGPEFRGPVHPNRLRSCGQRAEQSGSIESFQQKHPRTAPATLPGYTSTDPRSIPLTTSAVSTCTVNGECMRMIEFMVRPRVRRSLPGHARPLRILPEGSSPGWQAFLLPRGMGPGTLRGGPCSSRSLVRPIPSGSLSSIGGSKSQVTYGEFCYTLDMLWRMRRDPRRDRRPERSPREGEKTFAKLKPVDRILNRLTMLDWRDRHGEIEPYTHLLWECPQIFAYHPYLWYLGERASSHSSPIHRFCATWGCRPRTLTG